MKAINKQATKVMNSLTCNGNKKIDNVPGFMAVHIEHILTISQGKIWSVAHYYKQNGDLCRDPDMEFLQGADGQYYPLSFRQDLPPVCQEAAKFDSQGQLKSFVPGIQRELVGFANTWLNNIKEQQGL